MHYVAKHRTDAQVAMSDLLVQTALLSTDPSSQTAIQVCFEPKIASYLDCIMPESQHCVLQWPEDVSLVIRMNL